MSSASVVPETRGLTGDDALVVLRRVGLAHLAKSAFQRLRVADGFSHVRSLAFLITLVAIQGLIGVIGIATLLHKGIVSRVIDTTIRNAIPGPAGRVLTITVTHATQSGESHHYTAIVLGLTGALVTATTAMAQFERGLNRLYGVEQDRKTLKKYALAFFYALSAGSLTIVAFVSLAFGSEIRRFTSNALLASTWSVVRWPLGVGLIAVATTLLFRWLPRRRQPHLSWLAVGSGISVLLWVLVTAGLGLFYRSSSSFGTTYGPLAGVVALLLWSFLSSLALFYGASVAAQLEAVRVGEPGPQDESKAAESYPDRDAADGGVEPTNR